MLTPKGQKRRVNVPRHPRVKSARGLQETMFSNDVGKVDNKPLVFLNECLTPANTRLFCADFTVLFTAAVSEVL